MVCIYCRGDTQVINSRHQKRHNQVWRRRECKECGALFTTHEAIELAGAVLVEKGSLYPFSPDILFVDLLKALKGRNDSYAAARQLSWTIISQLIKSRQQVYSSKAISEQAAKVLKRFDRQAWLRYIAEHPSLQSRKITS